MHEIGHLAGLWHTHQFDNDPIGEMVGDVPNVMSYKDSTDGEYGFALLDCQKRQLQDFFNGGASYETLRKCGFEFNVYVEYIAATKGYK